MNDIKFCRKCGKKISDINTADWYSHISVKYCPECAAAVKKEKTAERVRKLRANRRQKEKEQLEYIKLLEIENENFRRLLWEKRSTENVS